MRRSLLLSVLLLAVGANWAFASSPAELRNNRPIKVETPAAIQHPLAPLLAGENFSDAIPILAVPFTASGYTCDYANDITASCGGSGPEVVYAFTPATDMCVNITLCGGGTDYDSILDLFVGAAHTFLMCNDDFCGLQSDLSGVSLTAGNTYYIVVDGYGGDCGNYELKIDPCPPPCQFACPPGAYPEGEPVCFDGYVDTFNAGCNSTPETYSLLPCLGVPFTICGTYGTYIDLASGGNYRDTDWYKITLAVPTTLNASASGQATTALGIVDLNSGCSAATLACGINTAPACQTVNCSATLPAGTYAVFVATADFTGVPCGSKYAVTIWGQDCPTGTHTPSWGEVKIRYR